MSNVVQVQQSSQADFTPEQLKLITDTVARGATPNEMALFLYRSKQLGLDPLKPGQIYFVKYGNSPGAIVVGIDGFRAKAVRTGKLAGIKRGIIRDDRGVAVGAWAEVYRTDWAHPAREEVPMAEYNKGSGTWKSMPETMIKKVAEAAALRMAFPDDLGGVYEAAEMDQAAHAPDQEKADRLAKVLERPAPKAVTPIVEPAPEPEYVEATPVIEHSRDDYRIPFSKKYKGLKLSDIPARELSSFADWLEDDARQKNQQLSKQGLEFVMRVREYLGAVQEVTFEEMDLPL